MEYPLWMAKGDFDKPDALTVRSEEEESAARDNGYVSGHEFYSPKVEVIESDESYEDSQAIMEQQRPRRGRPRKVQE
jgi:hypothetical protein